MTWSLAAADKNLPVGARKDMPAGAHLVLRDRLKLLAAVAPNAMTARGVIVVSGPPGSGKTTMVSALAGVTPARPVYVTLQPRTHTKALWVMLAKSLGVSAMGTQADLQDRVRTALADTPTLLIVDEASNVGTDALMQLRWLTNELTCAFAMILTGVRLNEKLERGDDVLASRVSYRVLLEVERFGTLLPQLRQFHPMIAQAAVNDPGLLALIDSEFAHGSWRRWAKVVAEVMNLGRRALTKDVAGDAIYLISGKRPW